MPHCNRSAHVLCESKFIVGTSDGHQTKTRQQNQDHLLPKIIVVDRGNWWPRTERRTHPQNASEQIKKLTDKEIEKDQICTLKWKGRILCVFWFLARRLKLLLFCNAYYLCNDKFDKKSSLTTASESVSLPLGRSVGFLETAVECKTEIRDTRFVRSCTSSSRMYTVLSYSSNCV